MSTLSNFINSFAHAIPGLGTSLTANRDLYQGLQNQGVPTNIQQITGQSDPQQYIPGLAENAGNEAKQMVTGALQIPGRVISDIQNPNQIAPDLQGAALGFAKSFNNTLGQPFNDKTGSLQMPSLTEAGSNAYQHPLSTAINASIIANAITKNPSVQESSREPNVVQRAGNKLQSDVAPVRLKPSIHGAADEAAAQEEVNNLPGITASQKYANLQPQMTDLENQAQEYLAKNSTDVPITDIEDRFMENLQKQGVFRREELTSATAQGKVSQYIDNLYRDSVGPSVENTVGPAAPSADTLAANPPTTVDPGLQQGLTRDMRFAQGNPSFAEKSGLPPISEGETAVTGGATPYQPTPPMDVANPGTISTQDIFSMKQIANKDYGAVLRKMESGIPLSETDKVALAARNALDDTISSVHPELKDITMRQSRLFDTVNSLEAARDTSGGSFNVLGTTIPNGVATAAKGVAGKGISAAGGVLPSLAKISGSLPLLGSALSTQHPESQETSLPPRSGGIFARVQPDQTGHYNLPLSTSPSGTYYTTQDFQRDAGALVPGTPAWNTAKTKLDQSQALAEQNITAPQKQFMTQTPLIVDQANQTGDELHQFPPNIFNKFKTWNDAQKYTSGPYQQMSGDIDAMNNYFSTAYGQVTGGQPTENQLITTGDSPAQAQAKWNSMMQFVIGSYQQYQDPFLALSSATGTQQNTPQAKPGAVHYPAPRPPQDASAIVGGTPPPLTNLPPLPGSGGGGPSRSTNIQAQYAEEERSVTHGRRNLSDRILDHAVASLGGAQKTRFLQNYPEGVRHLSRSKQEKALRGMRSRKFH